MAGWEKPLHKSSSWTLQVPLSWGLGQVEIHLSLFISILLGSLGFLACGILYPEHSDLRFVAITLPVIWVVSLLVRLAVQILAIGIHGNDLETIVGPTGNLSTDYERLDGPVLLTFAVAGQVATLLLGLLGFTIHLTASQSTADYGAIVGALSFQGGWLSQAWASQILWMNAFFFALHLLPAAPFDMRAFAFGWWKIANRKLSVSGAYRALGTLNSHLACSLVGTGLAILAMDFFTPRQLAGGALVFVPAIYLFLVSRWEHSLANDIDDLSQFDRASAAPLPLDASSPLEASSVKSRSSRTGVAATEDSNELRKFGETSTRGESLDVDNILRKLYREGEAALTLPEKEALLLASRQLKAKRHSQSKNRNS